MKLITQILEAKDEYALSQAGLEQFINTVGKTLPKNVQHILDWCKKYGITDKETMEKIPFMSSVKAKAFVQHNKMNEKEFQSIQREIKKLKLERNLLPMFMDIDTRESFLKGEKNIDDMMLDLETERGRANVVRQYTPLMNKIVSQYEGKTSLDKSELISAAMVGLVCAMNEYKKPDAEIDADKSIEDKEELKKNKTKTFAQYAAYRMRNKILDDINDYSRVVRIPGSTQARHKDDESWSQMGKGTSIDIKFGSSDDDEGQLDLADKLADLQVSPEELKLDGTDAATEKTAQKIYKMIEDRFNSKHAMVFYKTFGLNGQTAMKPSEVAKEMGVSNANVSMINKRIATFLKTTPAAQPLLKALQVNCQESILVDNMRASKEDICEALRTNDMYILLEELTKWSNTSLLEYSLKSVLNSYSEDTAKFIIECLSIGDKYIDEAYSKNKKLFVSFLESMNPTQSFNKKSDFYILSEMYTLSDYYQQAKIEL